MEAVALFDFFRYGCSVFFVALQGLLMFGLLREWRRDKRAVHAGMVGEPAKVSVIIPVHNEQERMMRLLETILVQDYPAEIVFVDDRSDDESPAMLAACAERAGALGINCRIITLTENPGPNFKQFALSRGFAEAGGELLLLTDGDCTLSPGWIRAMVARMGDRSIGAMIGPVFKRADAGGFLARYQCYDHAIRYNHLAGAIGLGAAAGGFGNNLIVRRAALEAAGGYGAVHQGPTEDAALIALIRRHSGYRIAASVLTDTAVETCGEESWRKFVAQTLRWNNGGLFSRDLFTRLGYNLLMILSGACTLAAFLLPFFPKLWPLPLAMLIVMLGNTLAMFVLFRKKLPKAGPAQLGYVPALFFTPPFFTLITLMGYCRVKARWKGKKI